jgi:hypothetical protein
MVVIPLPQARVQESLFRGLARNRGTPDAKHPVPAYLLDKYPNTLQLRLASQHHSIQLQLILTLQKRLPLPHSPFTPNVMQNIASRSM